MSEVDAWRAGLDPDTRATVDALRALIARSHDGLEESIKWNAPSFAWKGEHRITLGVEKSGALRAVLHWGAKAKDSAGFRFEDPARLARWPAADRGVVIVKDVAEVATKGDALGDLFRRWIEATD